MDIADFAGRGPELLPEKYLSGELESRLGRPRKCTWRTEVPIHNQGEGHLHARRRRLHRDVDLRQWPCRTLSWKIRKTNDGKYVRNEPKVDGEARGEQAGFAFHWFYSAKHLSKAASRHA